MRIAFFGGTFDPPHCGHLAIARAAIARLALDRVLVAPVASQPLKENGGEAGFADRLAMVSLAVQGDPRLMPSAVDSPRLRGGPNYTLETLIELEQTLAAGHSLFCLLGADSFSTFRRWRRAAELALFCRLIIAARPGFALDAIERFLPPEIAARRSGDCRDLIRFDLSDGHGRSSNLYLLPELKEDVSATAVRAALAAGNETQAVLMPAVAHYIRARGLYGAASL